MLRTQKIAICCFVLSLATPAFGEPSTGDFEFLLGAWRIDAAFGQNGKLDTEVSGERRCAYVLNDAYIRCDTTMNRSSGGTSKSVSLHNYNAVYGYHESLYYSSGWPVKVLGRTTIEKDEDTIRWTNNFEFPIDKGRTEWVRAEMTVRANEIEALEYIKRSGDEEADFNLEYKERWTKITDD